VQPCPFFLELANAQHSPVGLAVARLRRRHLLLPCPWLVIAGLACYALTALARAFRTWVRSGVIAGLACDPLTAGSRPVSVRTLPPKPVIHRGHAVSRNHPLQ